MPGAMLQNRASLPTHTADPSQTVLVRGSFGTVRRVRVRVMVRTRVRARVRVRGSVGTVRTPELL